MPVIFRKFFELRRMLQIYRGRVIEVFLWAEQFWKGDVPTPTQEAETKLSIHVLYIIMPPKQQFRI